MEDVTIDLSTEDDILKDDRPIKLKRKKPYMIPIVILAVIALIIILIKLDIGKIGSKYVAPKIENIPILNKILPKAKEKGLYDGYTKEQLVDIISGTQIELEVAEQKIQEQSAGMLDLQSKIKDLEVFEAEYLSFKEDKYIFDQYVGNMEKDDYVQFYEKMYPENAQEIFTQIVKVQQLTKEQRKYSALISEMDATRAAKVLENLFQTDMDIILALLSNMETESASAILEEMDSKIAAVVVKQLSPQ